MQLKPIALLITLAACGSSGTGSSNAPAPLTETTRVTSGSQIGISADQSNASHKSTISAPIADVWKVLPSVYDTLGIPVTMKNAGSYTLGNGGFEVRQRLASTMVTKLFDCGGNRGGSSALSYDLMVTISTQLQTVAGGTQLATSLDVKGKPVTYSGDWVRCESLGVLEQRIQDVASGKLFK